jgi:hypothetical protein
MSLGLRCLDDTHAQAEEKWEHVGSDRRAQPAIRIVKVIRVLL